jgi:hypothetical protein
LSVQAYGGQSLAEIFCGHIKSKRNESAHLYILTGLLVVHRQNIHKYNIAVKFADCNGFAVDRQSAAVYHPADRPEAIGNIFSDIICNRVSKSFALGSNSDILFHIKVHSLFYFFEKSQFLPEILAKLPNNLSGEVYIK